MFTGIPSIEGQLHLNYANIKEFKKYEVKPKDY